MIVLGLDTTGADCSACIVRDDTVLAYKSEPIGRGHAERLAPMVVEVLAIAGVTPDEIDRIAVCTGPGSFTGLRVALSFAKGFALPRRTPVLGFDALYIKAAEQTGAHVVYRDVKRGQVFAARYVSSVADVAPMAMTMDAAQTLASDDPVIEAQGADVRVMAKLALTAEPPAHPATPLYARAPDAKLPGGITPPPQTA
ncbi:MAG: tRNA (adenosine(37)-N6)-threonylcarbamoyltransferase complex dimerization subunit type 1 TsaB [Litorimonas sp.]